MSAEDEFFSAPDPVVDDSLEQKPDWPRANLSWTLPMLVLVGGPAFYPLVGEGGAIYLAFLTLLGLLIGFVFTIIDFCLVKRYRTLPHALGGLCLYLILGLLFWLYLLAPVKN